MILDLTKEIRLVNVIVGLLQLPKSELDRINVNHVAEVLKRVGYIKNIYGIEFHPVNYEVNEVLE